MKEKPQELYLRYLKSLDKLLLDLHLDVGERQLLNAIAIRVRGGENLTIGDITQMKDLASPATLHTRLKSLREKKMISFTLAEDGRKKYVLPSPAAYKYFDSVGRLIEKAMNTKN